MDCPFPADYGGAIDMYQKILALSDAGIKIHLHYFKYRDNSDANELNHYCESVHVYERRTGFKSLSIKTPYIVSTRLNHELVNNLNKDGFPIILEGIHCTGILPSIELSKRKVLVRLHNDENSYYLKLANSEKSFLHKLFYWNEGRLLERYQFHLPKECRYACISEKDVSIFRDKYHLPFVEYLPAFTSWQEIKCKKGMGNFCLYHGNLSVPENEKAACWLLSKVFTKIKVPLVISGKNPSRRLKKMAELCQHTCLVENPSEKELNDLVQKAHINVLPSFNNTGIKLKLLHALFEGRHCVTNNAAVERSGVEPTCHVGNNENAIASIILQLYHQPFTEEEVHLRKKILSDIYNNKKSAEKIIEWLY